MQRKIKKKLFVFSIISSELTVLICLYSEEKTCDKQSMSSQTVPRFFILLRETFSDLIAFTLINKYAKGSELNSVWARLPCCFSKCLQKRDFLDIYLTTVFRVHNFQNNERCESSFF